jgi:hypothetical protein
VFVLRIFGKEQIESSLLFQQELQVVTGETIKFCEGWEAGLQCRRMLSRARTRSTN